MLDRVRSFLSVLDHVKLCQVMLISANRPAGPTGVVGSAGTPVSLVPTLLLC